MNKRARWRDKEKKTHYKRIEGSSNDSRETAISVLSSSTNKNQQQRNVHKRSHTDKK